jgi:glucokinase
MLISRTIFTSSKRFLLFIISSRDYFTFPGAAMNSYIGIDIGGTKIAIAFAGSGGVIHDSLIISTPDNSDFQTTADAVFRVVDSLLEKNINNQKDFSIGISCPGPLDIDRGTIVFVATTGWKNVPIVDLVSKRYGVPVYLENDCACAALAESLQGAGKNARVVFYASISTGIGAGICVDGKIFGGEHGNAGEFGHICVDPDGESCPCGGKGCLQLYASGTAIAARARRAMRQDGMTAFDVETAVRRGDPAAIAVWDDAMNRIGIGLGVVYQLFNPGAIIIGGGVSNAWDLMEERLYQAMKNRVYAIDYPLIVKNKLLRKAQLGNRAGVIGAVLLAREKSHKEVYHE